MDILRRENAQFPASIWSAIEKEAGLVFGKHLTGRKVVDFKGGLGIGFSSLPTGRVISSKEKLGEASVGVRMNTPVIELKIPFSFPESEVEAILREANAFDISSIEKAAKKVCVAENELLFYGLKKEGIEGLIPSIPHKPIKAKGDEILPAVAEGIKELVNSEIEGPYALLIQPQYFGKLFGVAGNSGYPLTLKLAELLQGNNIIVAPALKSGALLVSLRGGDYELYSGMDIGVGYIEKKSTNHELFFFETLTFRINTPEASIAIEW
ncbi:MAG: family 1 encapsulin nanocompartment shell protein [Wolinella sp.]